MAQKLNVAAFLDQLKQSPGMEKAGMILIHNGIVRSFSRDGTPVSAVEVSADTEKLDAILSDARKRPGIVAAEAIIQQGRLKVGDDLMLLGIAGDIRENVLKTLENTLNRIKAEVTQKKEIP